MTILSDSGRRLLRETQAGLPICPEPFAEVAANLGTNERDVLDQFEALLKSGAVRRIAAAANHYKLGMTANGMSVWDVDDAMVDQLGETIGALDFVTHCYRRPRSMPLWPYNLFAMVHGQSRIEVEQKRTQISGLLGRHCRGSDILYSTRILKKAGMRLGNGGG